MFYKCLPNRSMCFHTELCHVGKCSLERVTILLAANVNGLEKLKPLMIGKSRKQHCFKNVKSFPMLYKANKKTWVTSLFSECVCSLNEEMKKEKRKILLFIDNCNSQKDVPSLSHIRIEFLPPNTTSKLLPFSPNLINNFKTFYRQEIVITILDAMNKGRTSKITVHITITIANNGSKKCEKDNHLKLLQIF